MIRATTATFFPTRGRRLAVTSTSVYSMTRYQGRLDIYEGEGLSQHSLSQNGHGDCDFLP